MRKWIRLSGAACFASMALCLGGATALQDGAEEEASPLVEEKPQRIGTGIPRQNLFAQKYHFTLYEVDQNLGRWLTAWVPWRVILLWTGSKCSKGLIMSKFPAAVLIASLMSLLGVAPIEGVYGQGDIEFSGEAISVGAADFEFVGGFDGFAKRERNRLEPVTAEELERYNTKLGLDTGQVVFANELFTEYHGRLMVINSEEQLMHQELSERFRKGHDEGEGMSPDEMMEAMQTMERRRNEIAAKREALTQEFFADYKLVLAAEQLEEWPAIERMRRRERELAPGTFPGEDIDLIAVCRELELVFDPERGSDGPAALEEVLGRYEIEIDRLLQARSAVSAAHPNGDPGGGMRFAIEIDSEKFENWQSDYRDAGMRLRNGQQKYVRQVAELLSPESKAEFEGHIDRLSYPRIFARSAVETQVEAIRGLEDLDEEQRGAIERMDSEYRRARQRLDRLWMQAVQAELADGGGVTNMPGNVQIFISTDMESESAKARLGRRELDRDWAKRVRGVLRPEQAERVPEARPEPRGVMLRTFSETAGESGEEIDIRIEVSEPQSDGGN